MAWSDEPTYSQIETLSRWIEWHMPDNERIKALHWLKEHATRKEVSDEMSRVCKLYHEHKLNKEECFNSSVWEDYDPDGYEYTQQKTSGGVIVDYGV